MGCGNELQYGPQMLCDLWGVVSPAEGLQLTEQLANVTLMKNGDRFKADETKVRKSGVVKVRENAFYERVIVTKSI